MFRNSLLKLFSIHCKTKYKKGQRKNIVNKNNYDTCRLKSITNVPIKQFARKQNYKQKIYLNMKCHT